MLPDEKIAALLAVKEFEAGRFVVMGTRRGVVKKTELAAFRNPRAAGIIAMGVEEDDAVIAVQVSDGTERDLHRDARRHGDPVPGGRRPGRRGAAAYGVRGITLREGDEVVAMEVVTAGAATLLTRVGEGVRQANRP